MNAYKNAWNATVLIMVLYFFTNSCCKSPDDVEIIWERIYDIGDNDACLSMQQTVDSGYIIVGSTESSGADGSDVVLIKTDSMGIVQWTEIYGGVNEDHGAYVQQTSDGGYIIAASTTSFGASSWDCCLIKTDQYGNMLWYNIYGGWSYEFCYFVEQTDDGSYIFVGATWSYSTNGRSDVYIVKVDNAGIVQWATILDKGGGECAYSIQQTLDGGYIIAGGDGAHIYLIKLAVNGDSLWTKSYNTTNTSCGYVVRQTSDNGYVITGYVYVSYDYHDDVFILRTDEDGDSLWMRTYGGMGSDEAYDITQTPDGGFAVTGYTKSFSIRYNERMWFLRTDSNGNALWECTYTNGAYGTSVVNNHNETYVISGTTDEFWVGDQAIYLLKIALPME